MGALDARNITTLQNKGKENIVHMAESLKYASESLYTDTFFFYRQYSHPSPFAIWNIYIYICVWLNNLTPSSSGRVKFCVLFLPYTNLNPPPLSLDNVGSNY